MLKIFTPFELFCILSCEDQNVSCILLAMYVIDQHKVVPYCIGEEEHSTALPDLTSQVTIMQHFRCSVALKCICLVLSVKN